MSLSDRLKKLIKDRFGSGNKLAIAAGLNPKTINNIVNNSNSPNYTVVRKILLAVPDLSAEWLVRGEGQMWKQNDDTPGQANKEAKEEKKWDDITLKEFIGLLKDRGKE